MSQGAPYYHTIPACIRCRGRKTRCDVGRPFCTPCGKAGASCEYVDPRTRDILSREWITRLESRLQELELEYANKRGSDAISPGSVSTRANADFITLGDVGGDAHFLGVSSGIHLARAVLESAQNNDADLGSFTDDERTSEPSNNDPRSGLATPTPLPAQETALMLTENFFSRCQFPYPILVKQEFIDQLTKMYAEHEDPNIHAPDQSVAQDKTFFMTNMVLAISVLSTAGDNPQALKLAEHYYDSAVTRLTSIMRKKDLSSLQCLLLFLLYSLKHSTRAPIWYISGLSMRMCVDLGLHSEKIIWMQKNGDSLASRVQADTKRRLFWVTYSMDRTFSMILGRPFAFKDGSTDVQYPGVSLPENQREQIIHWIHLQQFQSEIVSQLYLAKASESDSQSVNEDSDAFIADMSKRLYEWKTRALTLADRNSHPVDWWDFWYFNSILLLTRPSPKHPSLNVSNMLSCYSASISIIQISFVQLNLKNRPISFTWSDIHHQMMAGITLLFTVWNSTEARTQAKKDLISFKGYLAQWNNVIEKTLKTWSRIDRAQQVLQRLAQSTVEVLEDEVSGVQSDAHARRSYSKVAKRASASHLSFTNTSNSHATPTNPISRTQNDHQRRDSTRSAPNSLAMIQFNENRVIDLPASMSSVQPSFSSYSPGQRATRNDEPPIYNETSNGVSPEDMNSLDSPDKHPFNPSVPSDYIVDQPWDFSAIFGTNPLGGWDSSNMELPFSAALDGSDASMDFSDLFGNAPGLDNGDSFVHAPIPGFQNSVTNSHYYTFNTASALNFQEP